MSKKKLCQALLQSGPKTGQQCGVSAKHEAVRGEPVCGIHTGWDSHGNGAGVSEASSFAMEPVRTDTALTSCMDEFYDVMTTPQTVTSKERPPLMSFTTSESTRETTRQYIRERFIPSVKSEIEFAWKEWAARPGMPAKHFDEEPWSWSEYITKVPMHDATTSEEDLQSHIRDFMTQWVATRGGEYALGTDMVTPSFGENYEVDDWANDFEYKVDVDGIEDAEQNYGSTLLYVDDHGIGYEFAVGYYYWDEGNVEFEHVDKIKYVPSSDSLKDNWQRMAFDYFAENAKTNGVHEKWRREFAAKESAAFDTSAPDEEIGTKMLRTQEQSDDTVLSVADLATTFPSLVDGLGRFPGGVSPDLMEALGDCIYEAPSRRNLKALEGYAVGDIRRQLNEYGAHPHPIDRFAGDGPSGAMEWDVSVLEVETGSDGAIRSDSPLRVAVAFGCRNNDGDVSPAFEARLTLDYEGYFSEGGIPARSLSWQWEGIKGR